MENQDLQQYHSTVLHTARKQQLVFRNEQFLEKPA